MGTPFRKVKSEIRELLALQANIAAVLDPLIRQGFNDFSPDIGVVNEYGAAPPQAPEVYEDGMSITLKPANTNTGPSTLSVNGMPRKPIVNADGTPLAGGEIQKDGISSVRFDGESFRLVASAAGPFLPLAGGCLNGELQFTNSTVGDNTVPTGKTAFHPNLVIDSGDTYTIDAGGELHATRAITVNGTLVVNGTCYVA